MLFRPSNKYVGSLCTNEINQSEIRILKMLQTEQFHGEIKRLKAEHSMTKGKFSSLNPFLDERDLIRVGGRLQNSNLTIAQKHPILLPNKHRIPE